MFCSHQLIAIPFDINSYLLSLFVIFLLYIQGGSDKSGILKIFLENHTAQLKIIRFY
jgi:hypothetical protein